MLAGVAAVASAARVMYSPVAKDPVQQSAPPAELSPQVIKGDLSDLRRCLARRLDLG
jgi:hypothetical protein